MVDFLKFLFSQVGRFFTFLDSITLVGTLSLFKVLIIVLIFTIILKFIGGKEDNDK